MRELLRHEIKSNFISETRRDETLLAAILHIQVLVKCSGKSPTDIQQMHMHVAMSETKKTLLCGSGSGGCPTVPCPCPCPYACVSVYLCVCVHREGTCSVPQKRNRKQQTANEAAMIATFSSFFCLRLINEHREKCDQM